MSADASSGARAPAHHDCTNHEGYGGPPLGQRPMLILLHMAAYADIAIWLHMLHMLILLHMAAYAAYADIAPSRCIPLHTVAYAAYVDIAAYAAYVDIAVYGCICCIW